MLTTLIFVLVALFIFSFFTAPRFGYYPSGGVGIVLIIILILWATGYLGHGGRL